LHIFPLSVEQPTITIEKQANIAKNKFFIGPPCVNVVKVFTQDTTIFTI